MATEYQRFNQGQELSSSEMNRVQDYGVVEVDTLADLSATPIPTSVNTVYVTSTKKLYYRTSDALDAAGWTQVGKDQDDALNTHKNDTSVHVPIGTILPWYGDLANIPVGWLVCDGQFNTPDLRGRGIVGHNKEAESLTRVHTGNTLDDNVYGQTSYILTARQSGYRKPDIYIDAKKNLSTNDGKQATSLTGYTGGTGEGRTNSSGRHAHNVRHNIKSVRQGRRSYTQASRVVSGSGSRHATGSGGGHNHRMANHSHSASSITVSNPNHKHSIPEHNHTITFNGWAAADSDALDSHSVVQPVVGVYFIMYDPVNGRKAED